MKELFALVQLTESAQFNKLGSNQRIALIEQSISSYYCQWQAIAFNEAIEYLEFAAKGKAGKKRNCNPQKSFPCGNSCQPWKNKDGSPRGCKKNHTDEAKQAQEWLKQNVSTIDDSQPSSKEWTKPEIVKELGRGQNGIVGVTKTGTVLKTAQNGKSIPDNEAEITKKAAELNLAPKVIGSSDSAIEMENLSESHRSLGTYDFGNLDLTPAQFEASANSFSKLHKSGIAHGDAHEDNVFFSKENKDLKFIDFGAAKLSSQGDEFLDAVVTDIRSYAFILRTQFELSGNSKIPKTEIEKAASQIEKLSGVSGQKHRRVAQRYLDRLKQINFAELSYFARQVDEFNELTNAEPLSADKKRKVQRKYLKQGIESNQNSELTNTFKSVLANSLDAYIGIVEQK